MSQNGKKRSQRISSASFSNDSDKRERTKRSERVGKRKDANFTIVNVKL